ncbi:MAG: HAMP domain-containing sensor histidine kinase, partial [Planctomycetota bacterium]
SDSEDAAAGHIEVAAPDTSAQQRWEQSLFSSLMALAGVATLSAVVILIGGVTMVGKPLNQLISKVHRVGEGDFNHPVNIRSGDELGRLGAALNQMCDQLSVQRDQLQSETASRVEAVKQLRHADRLGTAGRLAAGIAHEIGTPLNVVIGRAQLIQRDEQASEQVKNDAEVIVSEAQRITGIVRELLDFTRGRKPDCTMQSINELVRSTVDLMQPMANKQQVRLTRDLTKTPVLAPVDGQQIRQLLTNLIVNAIQSSEAGCTVSVTLTTNDQECVIRVADDGSGISRDDIDHIFEPFFTTKDVGEGTGLGLSISHGIVREHDGRIDVDSELGRGSQFTVTLPLSSSSRTEGTVT